MPATAITGTRVTNGTTRHRPPRHCRPDLPNSPARRPRDKRSASQTRDAWSLTLAPSLLFPDGREHGWIATIFKRPFPIPLQLVVPQVFARPSLSDWHEELARHIAQALQCTIRTGGFPCIEMIRGRPVRSQQIRHFIASRHNEERTGNW